MSRFLAASVLALASACSAPIPPRDHIVFHHGPHLAEGLSCPRCHGGAAAPHADDDAGASAAADEAGRASPSRPLLPAESDCRTCHAEDRCARCHTAPERAGRYTDRRSDILFDHREHAGPSSGQCVFCHADQGGGAQAAYRPGSPTMASCTTSCHREEMRELDCAACHTDLSRFRIEEVATIDHGPGFLRRHGASARAGGGACARCHEPTFCEDCHLSSQGPPLELLDPMRQDRDFVHRGDFLARHGVEVGLERGTCLRCHGVSFCDGCHQASGVGGGVGPGSPHPVGWLDPLSPMGHARAARRDLVTCVSCHESDAERTCVPCHRVGGVAGNPHPPGFGGGMDPLAHGVCRACHVPR